MRWPAEPFRARFVAEEELRGACGEDRDRTAGTVARAQCGCITTHQLALIGITHHVVSGRIRKGLLRPLFRGVHLWGGGVAPPGAVEAAAILACRGRGAIGCESAGALWGFCSPPADAVTVLRRSGGARSRDGLVIVEAPALTGAEVCTHCGLPVTSPLRTLLDLAARRYRRLEQAVSAAHAAGLIDSTGLSSYVELNAGKPGARLLRQLAGLEARGFTRSHNERRLRNLCRAAGLPQPRANARVHGWEVDFLWPEVGLVLEVDAFNTHGGFSQFNRDRRKQRALVAAGLPVVRVTDQMLHEDAVPVVADLAAAIARLEVRGGARNSRPVLFSHGN